MGSIATFSDHFLGEFLLLLLLLCSGIALTVGLTFLLIPGSARSLNYHLSSWYSLRRTVKPLERDRIFGPAIYRHHRVSGLFIVLAASYVLYQLAFHYQHQGLVALLAQQISSYAIADWLLTALLWFSVPAMLLILLFGVALATRPSRLKGIEALSNRWISTRRLLQPWEAPYFALDNLVHRQPRKFGLIVVILSAYSFTVLLMLYLNRNI